MESGGGNAYGDLAFYFIKADPRLPPKVSLGVTFGLVFCFSDDVFVVKRPGQDVLNPHGNG
jgi:hypothetical protein